MLRVRPVHYTSRIDEFAAELETQGLRCVENHGSWRVYDSDSGKVGVHTAEAGSAEDGTTELGFEVRDCEIFVRRTLEDGTQAELVESSLIKSAHGITARITAPDGFTFLADPSTDLRLPGADPLLDHPRLAVTVTWRSPDVAAANKVLTDIGARLVAERPGGGALFRAKNGGFVATAAGAASGVELEITTGD
ncbi:VOC family protein [Arthrobacter sp. TWP1-1]|uniref:VOC family protein n=1 Tax=Arthrobacter sp. TWP1-1 TaxID=2804568 RepID=UPI003CF85B15